MVGRSAERRGHWIVHPARRPTARLVSRGHAGPLLGGPRDGASPRAEAGDIVVIPHGDCYALANAPGLVGQQPVEDSNPSFRQLTAGLLPPTIRYGDSGLPDLRALCGFLGCYLLPFNPLLGLLSPRRACPRRADRAPAGWRASSSSPCRNPVSARAGSDVVLLRISELLFVEVIRRHVDALPPDETSWLAGLRDPVVSRALALLHGEPARAWSLHLARARGRGVETPCWPNVSRGWWGRC